MKIRSALIALCLSILLALAPSILQQIRDRQSFQWLVAQLEDQVAPVARVPASRHGPAVSPTPAQLPSAISAAPNGTTDWLPTTPTLALTHQEIAQLTPPQPSRSTAMPTTTLVRGQGVTDIASALQPNAPVMPPATDSAPPTATPTALPISLPAVDPTATALPERVDLQIRQSAAPDPVQAGALLTYTIQIENPGPGIAHQVVIHDILPDGLRFEGASSLSVRRGEDPQLLLDENQLTGSVSVLKVGGVITIIAPVRVDPTLPVPILFNQVTVSSATPDEEPANNLVSLPVAIDNMDPDLRHNYLPVVYK